MPKLRLKRGRFLRNGLTDEGKPDFAEAGEVVDLTRDQARNFSDLFEDPSVHEDAVAAAKAVAAEDEETQAARAAEEPAPTPTPNPASAQAANPATPPAAAQAAKPS